MLPLIAALLVLAITEREPTRLLTIDLNVDGKGDDVLVQSFPMPRVDLSELRAPPLYSIHLMVKSQGKIVEVEGVEGVLAGVVVLTLEFSRKGDRKVTARILLLSFPTPGQSKHLILAYDGEFFTQPVSPTIAAILKRGQNERRQ